MLYDNGTVLTKFPIEKGPKKHLFMICDTCFWCASSIEANRSNYHPEVVFCPACEGTNVRAFPLAHDIMEGAKIMQPNQQAT